MELDPSEIHERFQWARRQGHPQYLWPDVPPAAWGGALHQLEGAAASVLSGATASLRADDVAGARALGIAGFTSGLGPLVGHWLESGRATADELTARVFALHLRHGRARARRQREEAARAVGLLNGAGIEPVVVKSAHTAATYFPDAGARAGADVDLVVDPAEYERAERALIAGGYVRQGGQRSPRKSDLRFRDAIAGPRSLELAHGEEAFDVDLHDSLTRDFFGVRRVTIGDPRSGSEPWTDAPFPGARVLRQPLRLAYHALHASEGLENLRLVRLVELVLMIRADRASGALEWTDFLATLDRVDGRRFAYPALAMAERLAPGAVDAGVLAALRAAAPPRMRRVLDALRPADGQRLDALSVEERFMWCATPLEHAARVAHMLLPAPSSLSPRRLARNYRERLYRLMRLRVGVRRPAERRASTDA